MSYKIIVDSCGEFTDEMKESPIFESIPLYLMVEEHQVIDDDTFNQKDFLDLVKSTKECPRSACPSPEQYLEKYKCGTERVYVVTLSANLSGSYNSAVLAKQILEETDENIKVHVFDSKSASISETLIALKVKECEEEGKSFEEVVYLTEKYINNQNTHFVLEDLDTLRKNGRLTGIKMLVASALNIKPILGATPEGTIYQISTSRGMKKALRTLVEEVVKTVRKPEEKILAISHCNCKERAEDVKQMILQHIHLKDVFILDTKGVSTMYASDGGIIVVV
ncbi:MAG: DegV family protein [Suipraeoptans sp.]